MRELVESLRPLEERLLRVELRPPDGKAALGLHQGDELQAVLVEVGGQQPPESAEALRMESSRSQALVVAVEDGPVRPFQHPEHVPRHVLADVAPLPLPPPLHPDAAPLVLRVASGEERGGVGAWRRVRREHRQLLEAQAGAPYGEVLPG